jgi:hypothetical protein
LGFLVLESSGKPSFLNVMNRVVTLKFVPHERGRKRVVSKGPLHPDINKAKRWAEYLRSVGHYYEVKVEGHGPTGAANLEGR